MAASKVLLHVRPTRSRWGGPARTYRHEVSRAVRIECRPPGGDTLQAAAMGLSSVQYLDARIIHGDGRVGKHPLPDPPPSNCLDRGGSQARQLSTGLALAWSAAKSAWTKWA